MSHSANPTQYHPRYHKPEPQDLHLEAINAQDKFDQAVRFLVAQGKKQEDAAELVKRHGSEKFLAQRDKSPDEPKPDKDQK
jgi:hypothetical protein